MREVFNLFSQGIPQEGLSRMEKGRKRQGLVPDFLLRLPVGNRSSLNTECVLAELKVISRCQTRYKRNPRHPEKAVVRRASLFAGEYLTKAKKVDQVYGGVQAGVVGPVQAKLLSFPALRGYVFGAWGEASPDVHTLVYMLATSRQKYQQTLEGRWRRIPASDDAELAALTCQVQRELSLEAVRSQARCLLDRLQRLGAGAAAAARRRRWAGVEEGRMARERQAHQLSLRQGRPTLSRGQFLVG